MAAKQAKAIAERYQRAVIAHELGHWLNGDFGSGLSMVELYTSGDGRWVAERQERRAYIAAARILIAPWVIRKHDGDRERIAAVSEVPPWLVDLVLR